MLLRNVSHLLLVTVALGWTVAGFGQACPVKVVGKPGAYKLLRAGKPYFVRGAGGSQHFGLLAKLGGNSVRTWGAENAKQILDEAKKNGLTVTLGVWLGHSTAFGYHDSAAVKSQFEMCRDVVMKYKDHPALLAWSFGNEMEGNGDDPAVWQAIEEIASMCKKLDPIHPTMTVLAELGGHKLHNLHKYCPSIDIVGINSYGGAATLGERYKTEGGIKPYIVTEFGTPGPWESAKTSWEAPIELTSTEKAARYRVSYEKAVASRKGQCLGSYAFLWGNKQEATATWFGMLLPGGLRLAAADMMSELWTGRKVKSPSPAIDQLTVSQSENLAPGQSIEARLFFRQGQKRQPRVQWVLTSEATVRFTAGRDEPVPEGFTEAIVENSPDRAVVKMPAEGGGYRLFVYVLDDSGGAAVANVPLFVVGGRAEKPGVRTSLPLILIGDEQGNELFKPTGWMGNTSALTFDPHCEQDPHSGKSCAEVTFSGLSSWAGIVWQYPAGDWGDKPDSVSLTGAKTLSFWMKGAQGGEKVKVEMGILKKDKRYFDTASRSVELELDKEWRRHAIDLTGLDLSRIKTGFVLVVEGRGAPVHFYIDDVRYE